MRHDAATQRRSHYSNNHYFNRGADIQWRRILGWMSGLKNLHLLGRVQSLHTMGHESTPIRMKKPNHYSSVFTQRYWLDKSVGYFGA